MKITKGSIHLDDISDIIGVFDEREADILISYVSQIYKNSETVTWYKLANSLENFAKKNVEHRSTLSGFCFMIGAEIQD